MGGGGGGGGADPVLAGPADGGAGGCGTDPFVAKPAEHFKQGNLHQFYVSTAIIW